MPICEDVRMLRRRVATVTFALVCASVTAVTAAGAPASSAPPPALASLALTTADFQPGAGISRQATVTSGGHPIYLRLFKAGVRIGSRRLLTAVSEVLLDTDAASAASDYTLLHGELQSKAGRDAVAQTFAKEFILGAKGRLTVKKTVVGAAVVLDADSLRLPVTFTTNMGRIAMAIDVVQIDRALGFVILAGLFNQTLAPKDAVVAATRAAAHMKTAFTVANVGPPTISGTAAQGQTLTADAGSWTGAPSGFTYAWARCDATGNGCVSVANASAATYVLGAADSGSTVRVTVTGANTVGSVAATSAPTAPVP